MTARKKKAQPKKKPRLGILATFGLDAKETHVGNVRIRVGKAEKIMTRDVALLFAIKIVRSSSTLSDAEIVEAFSK